MQLGATVSGSAVVLDEALVADNGFTCSAVYAITADDVNNLERDSTVTVYAKDVYGYEVSDSDAELVDLHQVKEEVVCSERHYAPCEGHQAGRVRDMVDDV